VVIILWTLNWVNSATTETSLTVMAVQEIVLSSVVTVVSSLEKSVIMERPTQMPQLTTPELAERIVNTLDVVMALLIPMNNAMEASIVTQIVP
jgi:hypothetical protein